MSHDGLGPVSDNLMVTLNEAPTAEISLESSTICEGESTSLDISLTGTSPWHLVVMIGDEEVVYDVDKPYIESVEVEPANDTEISIVSLSDGTGCENANFEPVMITVNPLPLTPATPTGPTEVDISAITQSEFSTTGATYISAITQSEFSTTGATYADSYLWMLEPEQAGTISAGQTEMTCTIDWNTSYTGIATVKVMGVNDCGISEVAAQSAVDITDSQGIWEGDASVTVEIFPNPNDGSFTLKLSPLDAKRANIRINNAFGITLWEKTDVALLKPVSLKVNLKGASEGVYFLNIETQQGITTQKFMINK
jgi:hypothetical protein